MAATFAVVQIPAVLGDDGDAILPASPHIPVREPIGEQGREWKVLHAGLTEGEAFRRAAELNAAADVLES